MGVLHEATRREFEDPIEEWAFWADQLMRYMPEATFWDLFKLMYYIKVGRMIPDLDKEEVHETT